MKITTSSDIKKVNLLLYGRSKLGKTPLAATAPKPIFLDVEKRMVSLSGQNVPRIEINNWKDFKKSIKFLKGEGGKPYKTVVVDSLSELAQQRFAVHEENPEMAKNKFEKYSEIYKEIVWAIRELKSLPHNIVCIAKLKPIELEGEEKYRPLFPGRGLTPEIPYLFDCIFALVAYDQEEDDKKPVHERGKVLLTKPTENYEGGSPDCVDKIEVLNLTTIFDKILSGKTKTKKDKKK